MAKTIFDILTSSAEPEIHGSPTGITLSDLRITIQTGKLVSRNEWCKIFEKKSSVSLWVGVGLDIVGYCHP